MKRRIMLIAGILAMSFLSFAQQRLAILTDEMIKGAGGATSICIDIFESVPSGQPYGRIGVPESEWDPIYTANNHHSVSMPNGSGYPKDAPVLIGPKNEDISDNYKKFIKTTIDKYRVNKAGFNYDSYLQLQDEIWSYNGLEQLGKLDGSAADPSQEFRQKKKDFVFRYDLGHDASKTIYNEMVDQIMTLHWAKDLDEISVLTNVKFEEPGISFTEYGLQRRIQVHYQKTSFDYIEQPSQAETALNEYRSDYRHSPETATVTKYAKDPHFYVLKFTDADGFDRMNVLLKSNDGRAMLDQPSEISMKDVYVKIK